MAFNLFGKRDRPTDPETDSEEVAPPPSLEPARRSFFGFGSRETPAGSDPVESAPADEPARRGFFDRMKQAVTRTRENFSESIQSVVALTREVDESTIADLEPVLLAADIGSATTAIVLENLRQRAYRTGISSGIELKDLLRLELRAVLDKVARPVHHPATAPEVIMMVGVNGTGKTHHLRQARRALRQSRPHRAALRRGHLPRRRHRAAGGLGSALRRPHHQDQTGWRSLRRALRRLLRR